MRSCVGTVVVVSILSACFRVVQESCVVAVELVLVACAVRVVAVKVVLGVRSVLIMLGVIVVVVVVVAVVVVIVLEVVINTNGVVCLWRSLGHGRKRLGDIKKRLVEVREFVVVNGVVVLERENIGVGIRARGRFVVEIVLGGVVDSLIMAPFDDEAAALQERLFFVEG